MSDPAPTTTGGVPAAGSPAADPPPGYQTTGWDRIRGWRPSRRGLLLTGLLLFALVLLMLTATPRTGYLDPLAADPAGSRAVANVLGDQGVRVADVRTTATAAAAAEGATVLITDTTFLAPAMLDELLAAGPAGIVLVEPGPGTPTFERLAEGVEPTAGAADDPTAPRCELPAAQRAGSAQLPGARYDAGAAPAGTVACYDAVAAAALVVLPARAAAPRVHLLGSGHPLTNAGFDAQGNAALALGLLGQRADLVWWRPSPTDPALAGQVGTPIGELLPQWVVPVVAQIVITCLLVVWWRARRVGPLVVEPLPVVIRAGETTAGHARLLHANHARTEAATHLRARARESIRIRLALPLGVGPQRLSDTAAHRAGRPPEQVAALLYGPEPTDDAQLVALGHELAVLMVEVGGA